MNTESKSISVRYSAVAASTTVGSPSPSFCHSMQPSTAHRKIWALSLESLYLSILSTFSFGMLTWNGINRILRQIPVSVPRIIGLWLVASQILNSGSYSNSSPKRKRQVTFPPPESCFISPSLSLMPSVGSSELTSRADLSGAISVLTPSLFFIISVSGCVFAA